MYSNVYAAPLPNSQSVIEIFEVMILKIKKTECHSFLIM